MFGISSFHPGCATVKAITGMDHYLIKAGTMEESITRMPGTRAEFEPAVLEAWLKEAVGKG